MAKLKARNRTEIGRIEYRLQTVAVMSDGNILSNQGDGWKSWRKCKPDVTPQAAFDARVAHLRERDAQRPAAAAYRRALHAAVGLKNRLFVDSAISLMPDDPDGCWAELTDAGHWQGDLEEMAELCQLRKAAEVESAALKTAEKPVEA